MKVVHVTCSTLLRLLPSRPTSVRWRMLLTRFSAKGRRVRLAKVQPMINMKSSSSLLPGRPVRIIQANNLGYDDAQAPRSLRTSLRLVRPRIGSNVSGVWRFCFLPTTSSLTRSPMYTTDGSLLPGPSPDRKSSPSSFFAATSSATRRQALSLAACVLLLLLGLNWASSTTRESWTWTRSHDGSSDASERSWMMEVAQARGVVPGVKEVSFELRPVAVWARRRKLTRACVTALDR